MFPSSGRAIALKALVNHTLPQNLVLRLFINDATPGEGDASGKYQEATFGGYRPRVLSGFAWKFADDGTASYDEQSFLSALDQQTQSVYGYFVTQEQSGALVHAERFSDAPNNITNLNDKIAVALTLGVRKES